jgi:phosphoglycolate phosphatase-like HAD superfamily hydrolase
MEKPIIATNLDDLLIKHEVFFEPHKDWFDRAIEKTGDKSLENWKGKENYFPGVNLAMEKIMPDATPEQRTMQAREWYQEDVIRYIKKHPSLIRKNIANKLIKLKKRYTLILVTTNTDDYIDTILKVSKLNNIYDAVISSKTEEEPNKEGLIKELIQKYGKPKYDLSGKEDVKINNLFRKLGTEIINEKDLENL